MPTFDLSAIDIEGRVLLTVFLLPLLSLTHHLVLSWLLETETCGPVLALAQL